MGNCLYSSARIDASSLHSPPSSGMSKTSSNVANKTPPQTLPSPRTETEILSCTSLMPFALNDLKTATRNFRSEFLLGEGGFGCVYKGWIDHQLKPAASGSAMMVAVKRLKADGFQGHREWLTEVNYLGQLYHPNLVKLIGYCLDGESRLLVYEFMPKGSLENHLFRKGPKALSWGTRVKVAAGAAKGLAFLHEAPLIFRDFKASNILLDADFNAKLSDFGLVKEGPTGDRTHVSTRVMGTHGYAAPEYLATGRISARSDVYSFGVVLLELLSGRPAFDKSRSGTEQSLVDWAKPHLGDKRKLLRIMDTRLEGQYPKKSAMLVASLALRCLTAHPKDRPTMPEAVVELEQLMEHKNTAKYSAQSPRYHNKSVPGPVRRKNCSPLNVSPLGSPLYRQQSPSLR